MKKITLLTLFLSITLRSFSQSVNINDLKSLLKGNDDEKTLLSKSFQLIQTKSSAARKFPEYVINNHTPKAEFIIIKPGASAKDGSVLNDVSYMTRDTLFIKTIMKQINMAGLTLTDKKLMKTQNVYQFDSRKFYIKVELKKRGLLPSIVDLHQKF
jgi:hypothetical protein